MARSLQRVIIATGNDLNALYLFDNVLERWPPPGPLDRLPDRYWTLRFSDSSLEHEHAWEQACREYKGDPGAEANN